MSDSVSTPAPASITTLNPATDAAPAPDTGKRYQSRVTLPDGSVFSGDHVPGTAFFIGVRERGDGSARACRMDAEDVLALEADDAAFYRANPAKVPPRVNAAKVPPVPPRVNAADVDKQLRAVAASARATLEDWRGTR